MSWRSCCDSNSVLDNTHVLTSFGLFSLARSYPEDWHERVSSTALSRVAALPTSLLLISHLRVSPPSIHATPSNLLVSFWLSTSHPNSFFRAIQIVHRSHILLGPFLLSLPSTPFASIRPSPFPNIIVDHPVSKSHRLQVDTRRDEAQRSHSTPAPELPHCKGNFSRGRARIYLPLFRFKFWREGGEVCERSATTKGMEQAMLESKPKMEDIHLVL